MRTARSSADAAHAGTPFSSSARAVSQPAPAPRRQRHAGADLALEPQQALRQRVAEREVEGRDHEVDLERAERLGGDQLALRHQLGGRDRDQQRRRLEQVDEHRVRARQRRAQRLREDDVRERRAAAQAERLGRLLLAAVHAGDRRAEDLRQVGRVEDDQAQRAGLKTLSRTPCDGEPEVGQEDDREQRDVLEQLGVDRRRRRAARATVLSRISASTSPSSGGAGEADDRELDRLDAARPAGRTCSPTTRRRTARPGSSSHHLGRPSDRRRAPVGGRSTPRRAAAISGDGLRNCSGSPPHFSISFAISPLAYIARISLGDRLPRASAPAWAGRSSSCTGGRTRTPGAALSCCVVGGVRYCVSIFWSGRCFW